MKMLINIGLVAVFAAAGAAQNAPETRTLEIPRSSSFDIGSGRSFSASRGSSAKPKPSTAPKTVLAASLVSDLAEAMAVIRKNHTDGAASDLAAPAIEEMLRTLDPHSRYYDARDFAELTGEHQSEYYGTGMTIADFMKGSEIGVYVLSVAKGTAAETAGLKYGDRILQVDGKKADGMNAAEVRQLVRGPNGTNVRILIEQADSLKQREVTLRRGRISRPSVQDSFMLGNDVGYVALTGGFSFTTAAEFGVALVDLTSAGMRSLIIDIRGNGGGIFEQAVEIAEYFLPAGTPIVSQQGRYPGDTRSWASKNTRPETMPLVLMVDGSTASAAEILAGALQDNDRALIVGERTFGKGLVQDVIDLPDRSGLTLTAARYYTPSGRSIQRDYSDAGLYDYFTRTKQGELIATPSNAYRTVTNRTVFGGNGIQPDIDISGRNASVTEREKDPQSAIRYPQLNERIQFAIQTIAFFYVRDAVNGRKPITESGLDNFREEMRRRILFGEETVSELMIDDASKAVTDHANSSPLLRDAIRMSLRYNIALAVFDFETAERVLISNDPVTKQAVSALPQAESLANAASRLRDTKKARRVTSPTGLNR